MRISDWSSDVCSSDLAGRERQYRDRGSGVHAGGNGPAHRDRYRGAVRSARNIERQSARRAALRLPSRRGPAAGLRDRITAKRGRGSMTTPGTQMIREEDRKRVVTGKSVYVRVNL